MLNIRIYEKGGERGKVSNWARKWKPVKKNAEMKRCHF